LALDFSDLLELIAGTLEIELQFPWARSTECECTEEHHWGEQETVLKVKVTCLSHRFCKLSEKMLDYIMFLKSV